MRRCGICSHFKMHFNEEDNYCLDYEIHGDIAESCPRFESMVSCTTCANRTYEDWGGSKPCPQWEQLETDEEEKEMAQKCERYRLITDYEEEYCPSATAGDYSPSSPWNAPGMSAKDFF